MVPAVVKDQADRLSIRVIDPYSHEEVTPNGGTVTVHNAGNEEVFTDSLSFIDTLAFYDLSSWAYPLGTYRSVWVVTRASGSDVTLELYFEIVAHRWRMPIGESDFSTKYPYLTARIPTGASISSFLSSAWDEIGTNVYGRIGKHPGALQHPEQFSYALEMMAVSEVYKAISMQPGSGEASKSEQYRERAVEAMNNVLSCIHADMDDDLKVEEDVDGLVLNNGLLLRERPRSRRPFKL